jgi:DNA-directed RNA polymerase subunit omega
MLPSPDILNDYPHGKFVLSNLAAKRAKQLREGAPPLVQTDSNHPLTIALAEIAAGKIKPIMSAAVEALEPIETPLLIDETVPAELGMLLPALDESEAALISTVALSDDDHLDDSEVESEGEIDEVTSLSDLVGDDEEEVAAVSSDDDTLSLSDIAEQETSLDDEEADEI